MALIHTSLLRAAAQLVPPPHRSEWLREWTAELIYLLRVRGRGSAIGFCLGAFRDAYFVRSATGVRVHWRDVLRGTTPAACLALLAAYAIVAALIMWASPAVRASLWDRPVWAHALIAGGAMLLSTSAPGNHGFQISGVPSWCFMAAKSAILTVIVFFVSFDIVPMISRAPIQPQLAFVMYITAYRWALNDQRRRCPVCLRELTSPVRIGHSAGTLLEWYGAELMCARGHGVLHDPEPLASSYCVRRWVNLDVSWQELFR